MIQYSQPRKRVLSATAMNDSRGPISIIYESKEEKEKGSYDNSIESKKGLNILDKEQEEEDVHVNHDTGPS